MDMKRLVIVMVLSMAAMLIWQYAANQVRQKHPEWFPQESRQEPASTQPAAPAATSPSSTATQPALAPAPAGLRAVGARIAEAPCSMGTAVFDPDAKNPYPIVMSVTPRGASVASVTLKRFTKMVNSDEPYVYQEPYTGAKDAALSHALATRQLIVNGTSLDIANVDWEQAVGGKAWVGLMTYGLSVNDAAGKPLLNVEKEYQLEPESKPAPGDQTTSVRTPSEGYEVLLTYRFKNPTTQPIKVKTVFNGPNVPPVENSRDIPEVVVGYNNDAEVKLGHHPGSSYTPDKPATDLRDPKGLPLLWAGMTSAYFNAIVRPDGKTPLFAAVTAQAAAERVKDTGQEFTALTFETSEVSVPPKGETALSYRVYFGPRQRAVLNRPYYAQFPLSYDKTLVLTSGPCAFCTFQWLIDILVWMLIGFHTVLRDWGLAIIALVLVVRLLLHPVTKRSQISMSKMSKMGPEMERLKKKYGDNKEELNQAMVAFYKEQGAKPFLGCLPMLLQMPIWIALWSALQSTFELRHAPFLWRLTWIRDLAQPDRLIPFGHQITFLFFSFDAINLLPVLLGVVFYLQQKMTPKPAAMTPEQEQQQKMMQWTSLIFPLLFYSGPSGLNLYILTSTGIGIWESKRVRDHLKAQEEAERAGRVIIDAKSTRASRRHAREEHDESMKKGGCLTGWLDNLQKKAEEVRQTRDRRDKDKP